MEVQFSGMVLDSEQKPILEGYIEKVTAAKELDSFHVNTKVHRKAGNRYSYTTELRTTIGSDVFTSESTDWDYHLTVKESFKKLMKELKIDSHEANWKK
jgi:hypothetical protein